MELAEVSSMCSRHAKVEQTKTKTRMAKKKNGGLSTPLFFVKYAASGSRIAEMSNDCEAVVVGAGGRGVLGARLSHYF
jgi:hypothetical protein